MTKTTHRPCIIGLTGYAGVGKDTVADLLVTHAGFQKLAFADALRAEIAEGFGVDLSILTDRHTKETPLPALAVVRGPVAFRNALAWAEHQRINRTAEALGDERVPMITGERWITQPRSPREILQAWGTEYRRAEDENYWIRQLVNRSQLLLQTGASRLVITDVRYPNEADALRLYGASVFQLWQITRKDVQRERAHSSATDGAQLRPDLTLHNDFEIRHLQGIVRDAYCEIVWNAKQ